jgi:hypothetical protein
MYSLQIEHPVPDFDAWKKAFDSINEAESLLAAMREVWRGVQGTIMDNPQL